MDTGRVGTIGEGVESSAAVVSTTPTTLKVPDSPSENSFTSPVTPFGANGSLLTVGDMGSTVNSRSTTPGSGLENSFDDSGSPKGYKLPIMSRQSTMRKERTLHDVAKLGKLKDVQMFVAKKVDLNELDRHGVTPIFYAVAQGHLEVVRYLADNGAGKPSICIRLIAAVLTHMLYDDYRYHNENQSRRLYTVVHSLSRRSFAFGQVHA
jgi:ankyrin repeat protein